MRRLSQRKAQQALREHQKVCPTTKMEGGRGISGTLLGEKDMVTLQANP
jgi:hypothetical protein